MRTIKIGKYAIGEGNPVFIIGEAGVNHNNRLDLAKKLVDAAVDSGLDAVKFQTWKTEKLVTQKAPKAQYQKETTGAGGNQFEMIKALEMSYDNFRELKKYCDKKGIMFLSTPDEEESADFLDKLGVPAFKMSSGEMTNQRMLKHIASKGKPLILSTGMATIEMVKKAVSVLESVGFKDYILLHCNANYPTKYEDVNLKAMLTMMKEFPNTPIGYSDHTMGLSVPVASAALGARVIEKHFTLDKKMEGPDHSSSIEPDELKQMVQMIREAEKALGSSKKMITKSEQGNIGVMRKVIVAKCHIKSGEIITSDRIAMKRAGWNGLPPEDEEKVLGKKAKRDFEEDEIILMEDID